MLYQASQQAAHSSLLFTYHILPNISERISTLRSLWAQVLVRRISGRHTLQTSLPHSLDPASTMRRDALLSLVLDKVLGCCRLRASKPRCSVGHPGPGPGMSWSWVRVPPPPLSLPSRQYLQPLKKVIKLVSLVVIV